MKVLLVDDHPLILAALQSVICGLGEDVTVVAVETAAAARAALAAADDFELVLLDLSLGDADGFAVLPELRRRHPALPVVVVSASDDRNDVLRAIDLGAMGYVPKRASNLEVIEALRRVMSGGLYVPRWAAGSEAPSATATGSAGSLTAGAAPAPPWPGRPEPVAATRPGAAAETWGAASPAARGAAAGGPRAIDDRPAPAPAPMRLASLGLTPRQSEVLSLLLRGLPNKLIARELKLSVETVKDHVAAVLRTLNVASRTQAVLAVSHMTTPADAAWRPPAGGSTGPAVSHATPQAAAHGTFHPVPRAALHAEAPGSAWGAGQAAPTGASTWPR